VELSFRITFSAKQKVEGLRIPHHLKAATRWQKLPENRTEIRKYEDLFENISSFNSNKLCIKRKII
jgi:hypothetical protein